MLFHFQNDKDFVFDQNIRLTGTVVTYLDKLIKLQKWAIRTISNSHYRCHTQPLFKEYNILNITNDVPFLKTSKLNETSKTKRCIVPYDVMLYSEN